MNITSDPNFVRWLNASVNTYFKTAAGSTAFYVDGQEINFDGVDKLIELRVNGPRIKEHNKDDIDIDVDISLMCSVKLGGNDYDIHDVVGLVLPASNGPIPIYKHDGSDTPEYIGCLVLKNDPQRDVIPWGLIQVNDGPIRVNLTSVEAHYEMNL